MNERLQKLVIIVAGAILTAFALTAEWSGRMFRSDEGAEGMAAFREKRDASWIKE